MSKLSATQIDLLAYFAGQPHNPKARAKQPTYNTLVSRGLLEPIEEFPFHRTTEAGRKAIQS